MASPTHAMHEKENGYCYTAAPTEAIMTLLGLRKLHLLMQQSKTSTGESVSNHVLVTNLSHAQACVTG